MFYEPNFPSNTKEERKMKMIAVMIVYTYLYV